MVSEIQDLVPTLREFFRQENSMLKRHLLLQPIFEISQQESRHGSSRTSALHAAVATFLIAAAIAVAAPAARTQDNVLGTWRTLPTTMPINPVHVALMHTGKVLVVSGSGNYPPDTNYMAAIWDPATDTVTTMPIGWDMFCNGMVVMPDGRPFVMG